MLNEKAFHKKRLKILIIGLSIVFGGLLAYNLFISFMMKRFFANYEPPPVSVSTVIAKREDWKPTISAVGNFNAVNGLDVNSQASGNVVKIHFNSGQFVHLDDPLIDIDDSVEQATLKANESELQLQQINFQRQQDLFKKGAAPISSLDAAKAKLLQSLADVEKIKALIDQKHIKSPFSGKLGIRKINLGQYITPGETKIVSLQSLDPLFLEFYLPEQLLQKLKINQEITFSVDDNKDLLFKGKISAINSKVDLNTHNILVQATVANCPAKELKDLKGSSLVKIEQNKYFSRPLAICDTALNNKNKVEDYYFIPGMFASIEVDQPVIKDVIVIPSTAISYSLYGDSAFVVKKEQGKDNKEVLKVNRVFIKVGDERGNYTLVSKGINANDEVVSTGELKLDTGSRVTINNSNPLPDSDINEMK